MKIARKSTIFPTPCVFNAPAERVPLELGIGAGSEETRMMRLPDGQKSFKIGLFVLIQYRRVTDTQPASHVAVASTRYAYLHHAVKTQLFTGQMHFLLPTQQCQSTEGKNIFHGLPHPKLAWGLPSSNLDHYRLLVTSREGCHASRQPSDSSTVN